MPRLPRQTPFNSITRAQKRTPIQKRIAAYIYFVQYSAFGICSRSDVLGRSRPVRTTQSPIACRRTLLTGHPAGADRLTAWRCSPEPGEFAHLAGSLTKQMFWNRLRTGCCRSARRYPETPPRSGEEDGQARPIKPATIQFDSQIIRKSPFTKTTSGPRTRTSPVFSLCATASEDTKIPPPSDDLHRVPFARTRGPVRRTAETGSRPVGPAVVSVCLNLLQTTANRTNTAAQCRRLSSSRRSTMPSWRPR